MGDPEYRVPRAEWQRRLSKLRQDQATGLFSLAQRCIRNHKASLAYRLALDAIRANPDHEGARRVFGYEKYQNQWHTPFEVKMLRNGMVWHEKFGWIKKVNVPRWQRGERPFSLTWIDAAGDAKLHAAITTGWDILTEHYRIRSDHSIEAAVALGVKLENLHRVWRQVFLGYYASEADVEALFNGRPLPSLPLQLNSGRLDVRLFPHQGGISSGVETERAGHRHLDGPLRAREPHRLLLCRQRRHRADHVSRGHTPAFPAIAARRRRHRPQGQLLVDRRHCPVDGNPPPRRRQFCSWRTG